MTCYCRYSLEHKSLISLLVSMSGVLPLHPAFLRWVPLPTELVLAAGFRTCDTLDIFFFFFLTLQKLIAWKIPKVTQRLSGKVTSKAPGFHPLCSCPPPREGPARAKARRPCHAPEPPEQPRVTLPSQGPPSQAPVPLGSVSVVDP